MDGNIPNTDLCMKSGKGILIQFIPALNYINQILIQTVSTLSLEL